MTLQVIGPSGLKLIQSFEGLFLQAYDDSDDHVLKIGERCHGTLTIGWGHTTAAGPPRVYVGMEISKDTADLILLSDLQSVSLAVYHYIKVPLNQNQHDALVSFHYNTGWLAHPDCSLVRVLNEKRYDVADEDFSLYDRSNGHILQGLVRRRAAEARLFRTPVIAETAAGGAKPAKPVAGGMTPPA
jgi:lysozyme